tara:strand:+ start:982 stop:1584 length:603 start_codon:yes stop_codon:yes gene_type:complete
MASSKFRLNKKLIFQMTLILMGFFIIFFTYFYTDKQKETVKKTEQEEILEEKTLEENTSTFENIQYEGIDKNGNKFIINSEYAKFKNDLPNIIDMEKILARFFFKDGTVLKITSDYGIYDNITNDMEFEQNVKMYYLEKKLFSEKANFVNSENYLFVQGNVIAEGDEGDLSADRMDFDLVEKKLKISMYNREKVNIKVNY